MKNDIKHFAPKKTKLDGIYRGVIEDNNDPDKLGRVRVRVWGVHDAEKVQSQTDGIPTEDLPWAEPALGLIEGSVSGFGAWSVPLQGSHVFLFFEGGNWECPRFFATAPGQPTEAPDTSVGFNDPAGEYPREDRLDEPDFHRLARNEKIDETIVQHKNDNLDLAVPMANGGTWDEPASAYAAQYPHNTVITTHGGLTIELDSTPGAERVHVFHPSNSYVEIDKDGNIVFRNDGDKFEITRGTKNTHVLVDDNETIDVNKTKKVGNDEVVHIGNNQEETIVKSRTTDIGNDETETVGNNKTKTVANNETTDIGSSKTDTIGADWTVSVSGNITIAAGGAVTITGASINLN